MDSSRLYIELGVNVKCLVQTLYGSHVKNLENVISVHRANRFKRKKKRRRQIYLPIPFFSYCASSMDMLVPRGHPNDTFSESHVVFWNVRNVPDNRAMEKGEEKKMEQT